MARRTDLLEAALVGAGSAAIGALALRPFGLAPVGAVAAGVNGLVSGVRGVYDWRRPTGWAAAALDGTWGIVGTAGGLAVHGLTVAGRGRGTYVEALSRRRNRHVYASGWAPRRGFAFTAGNVVTGAGDVTRERRRILVERHEDLHVWQNRWFGPLYPLAYGGWMVGGAAVGAVQWRRRRAGSLFASVERVAYYRNPFERWAYARQGRDISDRM